MKILFYVKEIFLLFLSFLLCFYSKTTAQNTAGDREQVASEINSSLKNELTDVWYPASVDTVYGGFLSSFSFDFKPKGRQDKMIVTQSRHTWVNAKASMFFQQDTNYIRFAEHGFRFLKNGMWDSVYGGFYTLVDRKGKNISRRFEEKTAYGNAFAIYALSACYQASGNEEALDLAKKTFYWLEKYSHDTVYKGYYQHMYRNGERVIRDEKIHAGGEYGLKDQNSSIHLLEAFTELYQVWPDELLRQRLQEMLLLIRDRIVNPRGYMTLFFQPDWTPFSLKDSSKSYIYRTSYLDHVSFGHDVEIAYLMLEASHVLGLLNDSVTLKTGKNLLDHALQNGWDNRNGGFYDEGYYFRDEDRISIIKDTKNWWAQAEGLNTLLLFADYFPDDPMRYYEKFQMQWDYISKFLIDHEHGDWFPGGIDREPENRKADKGNIWKGCYHQYRSMENCVRRLRMSE